MIIPSQLQKALERTGGDIPERFPADLIGLWLATGLCIATGLLVMHRGGWRTISRPLPITLVREVYHINEINYRSTWTGPTNSIDLVTWFTNNDSPISNYLVWGNSLATNTIVTNYFITNLLFTTVNSVSNR